MRQYMTREVTKTTVKSVKSSLQDGQVVTEILDDVVLVGNVTIENAQKEISKIYGQGATALSVEPETQQYRMKVSDFIEQAELVVKEETEEQA